MASLFDKLNKALLIYDPKEAKNHIDYHLRRSKAKISEETLKYFELCAQGLESNSSTKLYLKPKAKIANYLVKSLKDRIIAQEGFNVDSTANENKSNFEAIQKIIEEQKRKTDTKNRVYKQLKKEALHKTMKTQTKRQKKAKSISFGEKIRNFIGKKGKSIY